MTSGAVACPRCGRPLDHAAVVSGPQTCPLCRGAFDAVRFDPPVLEASVRRMAEAGPQGAQACPVHPDNAAVGNCSRCGVFACALCWIETDGRVLCPSCFERLAEAGELPSLATGYRDYGRAQSQLVLVGLVLFPLGLITGPSSIYYGAKALAQRKSWGEQGRFPGIWALFVIGAAQVIGSVAFFAAVVRASV
jgi:hypothetical protein